MTIAEAAIAYDALSLFFAVLEAAARFPAWCHSGILLFPVSSVLQTDFGEEGGRSG